MRLSQMFNVRKDERRSVASLGGATFMLAGASIMLYGLLQALALDRYGPRGVIAILSIVAVSLLAGVWTLDRFFRRYRPLAQAAILAGAGTAATVLLALLRAFTPETGAGSAAVMLVLAIGAVAFGAFFSVATDRLKAAAGEMFDFEQIQRIDPLMSASLAAGLFAGGVFMALASGTLPPVLRFAAIPVAAFLGLAALMSGPARREFDLPMYAPEDVRRSFFIPRFGDASERRFILLLGAILCLSAAFSGLFMYAFGEALDTHLHSEADLSRFVGTYAAALTVATAAFAAAVGPLLRRMGLTDALFVPPAIVAAAVGLMLFMPAFWFVIAATFARDIIVTLQRTAFQSMLEGMGDDRRSRIWIWLDGPVATAGTLLGLGVAGAIAYLAAPNGIAQTVRAVAIAVITLLAARFWLTARLKAVFPGYLQAALASGDFKARLRAIEALTELRHAKKKDLAPLIDLAKDEREPPPLRVAALRTLTVVGDTSIFRSCERLLAHPDNLIRFEAIRAVAAFDWKATDAFHGGFSKHALITILKFGFARETDREIIDAIIEALAALDDPDIVPFMLKAVAHPSTLVRHGALRALRLFPDAAVIDVAKPFLMNEDPGLKAQAVAALWQFQWERSEAAGVFGDLMSAPAGSEGRFWGLYLIGRLRLRDFLGEAASALSSASSRERLAAAISLLKNGDARGFAAIEEALARGTAAEAQEAERLADHPNVPEPQRERVKALIHRHHLHYPAGLPTSEPLRVRLHDIPAACLAALRTSYATEASRGDRRKIEEALKSPGPAAPKGRIMLIGVEGAWAEMATVCFLAHGYLVRIGASSDTPDAGERAVCGPAAKGCPEDAVRLVAGATGNLKNEVSMVHAAPSRLVARVEGRQSGAMTVFQDREEAGRLLAAEMLERGVKADIVLALPRGGAVLGRAVADALGLPLDIAVPRRIGAQDDPEFTIGAVTETGETIWNEAQKAQTDASWLAKALDKERAEAKRRFEAYRVGLPPRVLGGKTVAIVDDGIANGYTVQAAIASVRAAGAARVIVAVPVAAKEAVDRIGPLADEWVVLYTPEFFWALSAYYLAFDQVDDAAVLRLLKG